MNMEIFNERKLNLLQNIGKLIKAIDDEVDWYIASCTEKNPIRRKLSSAKTSSQANLWILKPLIQTVKPHTINF